MYILCGQNQELLTAEQLHGDGSHMMSSSLMTDSIMLDVSQNCFLLILISEGFCKLIKIMY